MKLTPENEIVIRELLAIPKDKLDAPWTALNNHAYSLAQKLLAGEIEPKGTVLAFVIGLINSLTYEQRMSIIEKANKQLKAKQMMLIKNAGTDEQTVESYDFNDLVTEEDILKESERQALRDKVAANKLKRELTKEKESVKVDVETKEDKQMTTELEKLQQTIVKQQAKIEEQQRTIAQLESKIKDLEDGIEERKSEEATRPEVEQPTQQVEPGVTAIATTLDAMQLQFKVQMEAMQRKLDNHEERLKATEHRVWCTAPAEPAVELPAPVEEPAPVKEIASSNNVRVTADMVRDVASTGKLPTMAKLRKFAEVFDLEDEVKKTNAKKKAEKAHLWYVIQEVADRFN